MVVDDALCVCELATWVPVKAKKRNRKVPANSPAMAMRWFRTASGLAFCLSACCGEWEREATPLTGSRGRETCFALRPSLELSYPGERSLL